MNCSECSALARVIATRTRQEFVIVRRHECTNGHRFNTVQVLEAVTGSIGAPFTRAIAQSQRGVTQRRKRWVMRQKILAGLRAGEKFAVIAMEASCSVSMVQAVANKIGGGACASALENTRASLKDLWRTQSSRRSRTRTAAGCGPAGATASEAASTAG